MTSPRDCIGRPVEALATPSLLIDADVLEHNLAAMRDCVAGRPVAYRPHTKSHKSPVLARMQIAAGARGVCCAKLGEAEVMVGDGVSDVNLQELVRFHRSHGKLATVTAVRPPARFGGLEFDGDLVRAFTEKPQTGEGWINGGFFVFEPEVLDYLCDDDTSLEHDALHQLAADGQLAAYRHEGFWQCMDTLRDKHLLETLWQEGQAPWKATA